MAETDDLQAFTSIMDALVRISSNMKSMECELQCPLCKEMVKQPVVLPCLHSVCLVCASEVLVQHGYPVPDPVTSEPSSPASTPHTRSPRQGRRPLPKTERLDRVVRSGFGTYPGRRRREAPLPSILFPCPSCQCDVELGERGLADCLRNLTLERVVERYRHTVSLGGPPVMCQFCKSPPAPLEATKSCTDCRASFCNECFKLYHPWGTPRAQHEYMGPTLTFRPKVLMCPEHDQEKVSFYCKSCQRLVCPLCKLRRVHAGHKVTPVANAYQALKEKLTKGISYILANQEMVQSQIGQLQALVTQTEINSSSAREEAGRCLGELCAALEERQGALFQALEASRQRRVAALAAQVSERQALLEHAGLLAFTQEVLKETDHSCFVQAAKQIHNRMVKAMESLQNFSPLVDSSFKHFQLDVSQELKLLSELNFIRAPLAPVIDTQRTLAYDQLYLCWRLPVDSAPAWHYTVEFRRTEPRGAKLPRLWRRLEEVSGTSAVIERLEIDCMYVLRVKGFNKAGFGEYSEEIYLHTPPAPVLNFFLDARWGFHGDRLILSKDQRAVRSVPGVSLLQAAERALTSCHLTSDLLIGDMAVTQGRHYWACSVDPGSYLVKVGVGLEARLQEWFHVPQDVASPRYDPDSGHDSGAEDAAVDSPPPFSFLTVGMGKVLLPQGGPCTSGGGGSNATSPGAGLQQPASRDHSSQSSQQHQQPSQCLTAPLPSRLGVCLDFEKGRVSFYDATSLRPLWEGPVDCSAPVCPAFSFIGGGALQVQELVANRSAEQQQSRRVTIQSPVTN
ncbi:tripartite motif-containing protein 46-like isoform X1 [Huso huso]|uniref:Tripartite motif-containing protein 46-like isoform X1 n=1 Tax=Huso huso TaxID=61971 RepID=A0ABR0Y304_HUSHU